jgi:hypothetical protein
MRPIVGDAEAALLQEETDFERAGGFCIRLEHGRYCGDE